MFQLEQIKFQTELFRGEDFRRATFQTFTWNRKRKEEEEERGRMERSYLTNFIQISIERSRFVSRFIHRSNEKAPASFSPTRSSDTHSLLWLLAIPSQLSSAIHFFVESRTNFFHIRIVINRSIFISFRSRSTFNAHRRDYFFSAVGARSRCTGLMYEDTNLRNSPP